MTTKNDREFLENWLKTGSPELADVPNSVKMAAFYFILLWSLFDLRKLDQSGSRDAVEVYCQTLPVDVDFSSFEPFWDYFQGRYANATGVTEQFYSLVGNDYLTQKRLEPILAAQQGTAKEKLAALVFITFRLRCNLVHGGKHVAGLVDQYDNLMHGAKLMTLILGMNAAG